MRRLPAFLLSLAVCAAAAAACEAHETNPAAPLTPTRSVSRDLGLYSPRVRRSTINYLRLRLLELREEGLDRASAAIERRLSIDELIAGPPHAKSAAERKPASAGTPEAGKERRP